MTELTEIVGFGSPITEKKFVRSHHTSVELLATLALAVCLVIAVTAVSIGVARAQCLHLPAACHRIAAAIQPAKT